MARVFAIHKLKISIKKKKKSKSKEKTSACKNGDKQTKD